MSSRMTAAILLLLVLFLGFFYFPLVFHTPLPVPENAEQFQVDGVPPAQTTETTLKVAGRDWGYPTPYAFYPRGPGYVRMTLLFDTLAWRDENGVIPWLAQEWRSSSDGKKWVVKLAEDIRWHDGKPLGTSDVKFTFDYMTKYPHPWFDHSAIQRVEITGPHEITFTLRKPYAVFATRILSTTPILPRHIWKGRNPYRFVDKDAFIGSGPFKLGDYDQTQGSYLFVANQNFFKGTPTVERLIFVPTNNPCLSLRRGDIDMARVVSIDSLGMFNDKPEFKILTAPDYRLFRLVINFDREPMDRRQFRRALAYAINQPEIIKRVAHGGAVVGTYGYISPASEWHNPNVSRYPFNPAKANELLDELNFDRSDDSGLRQFPSGKTLSLELLSDNRFTRAATVVKKYLEDVGIQVRIISADVSIHDRRIHEMQGFHLALAAHAAVTGDVSKLTGGLRSIRGYENREFLRLAKEQLYLPDKTERKEALWRIQELIAEDVATIPLYYARWFHVYRPASFDGWFYTKYGVPLGVQLLENKLAFLR